VLRDDGTLWVEIGDSFSSGNREGHGTRVGYKQQTNKGTLGHDYRPPMAEGVKPKDLLGQPWLLAFALRADGWYLRSEIIWVRPNPMPESVTDRPTKAHSTVFLLSKKPRYFYDAEAIREEVKPTSGVNMRAPESDGYRSLANGYTERRPQGKREYDRACGANARSVWNCATEPTPFAHFATWPQALVRRMILAGTSERGVCPECGGPWVREVERAASTPQRVGGEANWHKTEREERNGWEDGRAGGFYDSKATTVGWKPSCGCVEESGRSRAPETERRRPSGLTPEPATILDPFGGSGTTALVARKLGRKCILIELNPDYCELASDRLSQQSLFTEELMA
jgi:hypothetical protein